MARRSKPPKRDFTTAKIAVIGILVVILLLVIVVQFEGEKNLARTPSGQKTERGQIVNTVSPTIPTSNATRTHWPTFDVASVVASNPFVLPEELLVGRDDTQTLTLNSEAGEAEATITAIQPANVREMRRRQTEFMASLRAVGVDMILRSPQGSVARIGDLTLRVGDVHEGLRVESIGDHGVVFAPATAGDGLPE